MSDNGFNDELEVLAETESFVVLKGEDMEGEVVYNVQLGTVTLHLFLEEWQELVELIQQAAGK